MSALTRFHSIFCPLRMLPSSNSHMHNGFIELRNILSIYTFWTSPLLNDGSGSRYFAPFPSFSVTAKDHTQEPQQLEGIQERKDQQVRFDHTHALQHTSSDSIHLMIVSHQLINQEQTSVGTRTHGHNISRFGHLIIDFSQGRGHLVSQSACK